MTNTATAAAAAFAQQLPVSFEAAGQFSPLFLDYMAGHEALKPFYHRFPALEAFGPQAEEKGRQFTQEARHRLADALHRQYAHLGDRVPAAQIDLLRQPQTFTVTTGHQLNIFSGPLYFIYKIASAINLAKRLAEAYPQHRFVPVYWMATEDHDFEEIRSFWLFGQKRVWETAAAGAVGRLATDSLAPLLEALPELPGFFREAYRAGQTLAQATRAYVHHLFGGQGLLCLDGDDAALKAALVPMMEEDLFRQSAKLQVEQADAALASLGYKTQIYARYINFFYLENGLRERIEWDGQAFQVLRTDLRFSPDEMRALLAAHPERLSPNVVLRPLYQELLLPNLAYLGGPAEVAYWLQLKGIFDAQGVLFPLLMPRNFAMLVSGGNAKKFQKLGLAAEELFLEPHELKRRFVAKHAEAPLDLSAELAGLEALFAAISAKATEVDPSLAGAVGAEQQKAAKSLEQLEKRMQKAAERQQETALQQLLGLKDKLFPNGSPQERVDNFLNFYLNDPAFLDKILASFDPLDFRMQVLVEG
jgi:bacillithiol biosynthesis cysteine-adding enzyme BshC